MEKKRFIGISLFIVLFLSALSYKASADIIYLKNGNTLKGNIIEEKEDYIIVEINGGTIKFGLNEVKSIERSAPEEKQRLEQYEEAQRLKGLIEFGGEWMTPEEKEKILESDRLAYQEKKRQEKEILEKEKKIRELEKLLPPEIQTARTHACINNMRIIDAAKHQWALEKRKSGFDRPSATEIAIYIRDGFPICLAEGTYTIGTVDELPSCSIHGELSKGY